MLKPDLRPSRDEPICALLLDVEGTVLASSIGSGIRSIVAVENFGAPGCNLITQCDTAARGGNPWVAELGAGLRDVIEGTSTHRSYDIGIGTGGPYGTMHAIISRVGSAHSWIIVAVSAR